MVNMYANIRHHERLMRVLERKLGHELAARAEQAKIDVALTSRADIDLSHIEADLAADFDEPRQAHSLADKLGKIVDAAKEALRLANIRNEDVGALYFTGGSTGLRSLTEALAGVVPNAERVTGDRFASVVSGLGVYAARRFG